MFDMKLGAIAAGAAFLLSFLVGLVSGAGFLLVLIRALVFAALFFGFGVGSHMLLSRFLPELLGQSGGAEGDPEIGTRVDLVVGDEGDPSAAAESIPRSRTRPESGPEEGEELEVFMPADGGTGAPMPAEETNGAALDQGGEGRYTEPKDAEASPIPSGGKGAEPALPPGLADDVDVLPDLESLSDSFVAPLIEEAAERSSIESLASRPSSTSQSSEASGDFDPREMAQAIQTILKRDQKG